ncbi:hypothetical protein DL764_007088 [Monosporascus ibericus]|uniref:2EXR domain-containing protein n=1 Tax=Monosporascus ibericus TaxID=155417 RepID=A0A4Q4T516_9PEZI|nr:hypothetical protein DL764_007088 [Monosporascus ibericus]
MDMHDEQSCGEENGSNSTIRIGNTGTNSDSTGEGEIRERRFNFFPRLPPELRFDVYRMAVFDLMNIISSLCVYYSEDQHGGALVVLSRHSPPFPRSLWQTHEEARQEVANYCLNLPVGCTVHLPTSLEEDLGGIHVSMAGRRLVEGPFDEDVVEMQVGPTPNTAEDEPSWTLYSPYHIHPILGTMIVSMVQQTLSEVESLREAGIDVGWCLIKTGVTRRPAIIE